MKILSNSYPRTYINFCSMSNIFPMMNSTLQRAKDFKRRLRSPPPPQQSSGSSSSSSSNSSNKQDDDFPSTSLG